MFRIATNNDIKNITELFWSNISANPSYISHGEMQMGIADNNFTLAADGREKWIKYIADKIEAHSSEVFLSETEGVIDGFIVMAIESDSDEPYGLICDIVVDPQLRGRKIGSKLLGRGVEWLGERGVSGIYLESGVDNSAAHKFFERHGFRTVSHIFKLGEYTP